MEDFLIVDGYNIINGWPELSSLKKENFAHARDRLLDILSDYQGITGTHVIVVFDAHFVKGGVQKHESHTGIDVIFSHEGETADAVIEKLVGMLPSECVIGVATSDSVEQGIVFGRGAHRLSARDLYRRVQEARLMMDSFLSSGERSNFELDAQLEKKVKHLLEKWRRR